MSTSDDMRLAVVGASGRMGRTIVRAIAQTPGLALVAAIEREDAPHLGADVGPLAGLPEVGIAITADARAAIAAAEAVIDFTSPQATCAMADLCAQAGTAHITGTTGLSEDDLAHLRAAAARTTIVQSGNMSMGVNLIASLVRRACAALGPEFDVEIVDMHHRHKVDAPSGTALLLGEAAAQGRGIALAQNSVRSRDGVTGPRPHGAIGFAALRGGSVVGEHQVILAGPSERIVIGHIAEDRALFAEGALRAALWARGRGPGFHSMADVLGLD